MADAVSTKISVVIATFNRADALLRTLRALESQSTEMNDFEVIVVADGCTDDTVARLGSYKPAYRLTVVEQGNSGPALARNAGAHKATGALLLFLDDDIVATPDFLSAHLEGHGDAPVQPSVVIGYLPTTLTSQRGIYASALRGWWEAMFDRMAEPGRRFSYTDFLSGNVSMPTELFNRVGGFEPKLRCHEDYELGYRLIETGACFNFSRRAKGYHVEATDLSRSLRRQFDEGVADVWIAGQHSDIISTLRLANFCGSRFARFVQRMAFASHWAASLIAGSLRPLLWGAELFRLRRVWRSLANVLLMHHYWRGVAQAAGDRTTLQAFLYTRDELLDRRPDALEIDLSNGIAAAGSLLSEERPTSALLRWGDMIVGLIPFEPGAERLHRGHLRPLLSRRLAWEFYVAVGVQTFRDGAALIGEPALPVSAPSNAVGDPL